MTMDETATFHPGEILRDRFMVPLGLSLHRLASDTKLSPSEIGAVLAGDSPVDERLAAALAKALSTSVRFWLRLQENYDRKSALKKSAS